MRRAQHAASPGLTISTPKTTRPRPISRIAATAAALALIVLLTRQGTSAAAPAPDRTPPVSILPTNVGIAIGTQQGIRLDFASPMDTQSLAAAMRLYPQAAYHLAWSEDARHAHLTPVSRWQTDTRYELDIPASAALVNGSALGAPLRFAFTTETAPTITAFSVSRGGPSSAQAVRPLQESETEQAAPEDTAAQTSARASITLGFSAAMSRKEVERGFVLSPAVKGSFTWLGTTVTFTPSTRLDPSARYAVAVIGAHDLQGNPLGGDVSFSFNTVSAVHVARVSPANGAKGVRARGVLVAFSGPVDARATGRAFSLVDMSAHRAIRGTLRWNTTHTQLSFMPKAALLPAGHRFQVHIGKGSVDADGNSIRATFAFTTKAPKKAAAKPATASAPSSTYHPVTSAPPASGSAASYALALINASRSAYGFAPLRLDSALSAVAQAHATDQVVNNYFSHNSLSGMTPEDRMRAAGISFTRGGENQCYDYGSLTAAIAWCHSIMMAEPYPGYWNHIGNILSANFTRVGFGAARKSNGEWIMTWDFAN